MMCHSIAPGAACWAGPGFSTSSTKKLRIHESTPVGTRVFAASVCGLPLRESSTSACAIWQTVALANSVSPVNGGTPSRFAASATN